MRIVLYAAVSVDGFIADENGGTDWVKDDEFFEKTCYEFGCIVMGHKTFKEYGEPPFENVQHLVLSSNAGMDLNHSNVNYVNSPENAVKKAKELGFDKLLVIGGGKCNASFAKAGLVDELWLDIHPLILGSGVKLLGDCNKELDLQLSSSKTYDDFVHLNYKVSKNE
jgi:dihydrofolate reductase